MKITLGSLNFNNIKELTTHLEQTYEASLSIPSLVYLDLDYDAEQPESNKELLDFLAKPGRSTVYNLNIRATRLSPAQEEFKQAADKIYLENKENILILMESKLTELATSLESGSELMQQVLEKNGTFIEAKINEVPGIVPFLNLLLSATKGTKKDLERYATLLSVLSETKNETLSHWIKTLTTLAKDMSTEQKGLLLDVQERFIEHRIRAKELADLFNIPPYPKVEEFLPVLQKYSDQLQTYIDAFDLDPKGSRSPQFNEGHFLVKSTEQILDEQFETTQVARVVANMQHIFDGTRLAGTQQFDLAQQVIYINAIGKKFPLLVNGKEYLNMTTLSRTELRELTDLLVNEVRIPGQSPKDKLKAQLNLLAVLREQYFRSTGIFINTTQLMSVLVSLQEEKNNLLIDIDSTERERAVVAILAVMQWVAAEGGSVDVCLTKEPMLTEDYNNGGLIDFYASLGVPSSALATDAPVGTYKPDGINYATLQSMAAYRSRAQQANESLIVQKNGGTLASNLIMAQHPESVPEPHKIADSVALKELIGFYKLNGRILNLEHIESKEELIAQRRRLAIDSAYYVPSHQKARHKSKISKEVAARLDEKSLEELARNTATESIDTIQRVLLQQFEDWQVLLHLIHPEREWKKLDKELAKERASLISAMNGQWMLSLKESDSEQVLSSFQVVNGPKQQNALNKVITHYEDALSLIWNNTRIVLKAKTEDKLPEDSINALRCKCLDEVLLSDQLKAEKLAMRQHKKMEMVEKKKASRYVASGLDVNGAMLNYSSGNVNQYREPFAVSQFDLIAHDMDFIINNSTLSEGTKAMLRGQIATANKKFLTLELVLIEYDKKLVQHNKFAEKYEMQSVIHELLKVHKEAGLEENDDLTRLRTIYLDNAVTDVVSHLEKTLSWAKPEHRGFWYWIERSAVKNAANEVLAAVDIVKNASDFQARQAAIKNLYRVLSRHQAEIKDIWIFSFGHKNTRNLINETLTTLNGLTVIGSGEEELNEEFIIECKEEGLGDVLKKQVKSDLEHLEKKNSPWLKANSQWQEIISQLDAIQADNNTPYVINEMYHFVDRTCEELAHANSAIFNPLIQLRGSLRTLWDKCLEEHSEILNLSRFWQLQEEKIQTELNDIDGCDISRVTIKEGKTGFTEYFDVIIEGTAPAELLPNFERYNSQASVLKAEQEQLQVQLTQVQDNLANINNARNLLINNPLSKDDIALFPASSQEIVQKIFRLQKYAAGKNPKDSSDFPLEVQNWFHDQSLMKLMEFMAPQTTGVARPNTEQFSLEIINQLKDPEIKSEFIELYNKMNRLNTDDTPAQSQSWISRLTSFISSLVIAPVQENESDWRYHAVELKGRPTQKLKDFLATEIKKILSKLDSELQNMEQDKINELDVLNDKVGVLNEKIGEEERKTGVLIHRFDNFSQIHDFKMDIKKHKEQQERTAHPEESLSDESVDEDVTGQNAGYKEEDDEDKLYDHEEQRSLGQKRL